MASPTTYRIAYIVMVIAWAAFWPVAGYSYHDSNKKQTPGRAARLPWLNRLLLAGVFVACCICLASPHWDSRLLWVAGLPATVTGVLLMLLFLGIAWHAARLLAWQPVPLGERPAVVFASGPFAWTRHPTYVSITAAMWVTALLLARPLALYAAGIVTVAHLALILLEERSTRRVDPMAYSAYAERVPMLVPWPFHRSAESAAAAGDAPATAEALFSEASPAMSSVAARRAAKLAAKQAAKSAEGAAKEDSGAGKTGKGRGQGQNLGKRKRVGRGQPHPPGAPSRAWQILQGKQD